MKVFKGTKDEIVKASYKIDGVKVIVKNGECKSRAGKNLYNLPEIKKDGEYEIYLGNFKDTISACRTYNGSPINTINIFSLDPIDKRLDLGEINSKDITSVFNKARKNGYEGLVIRCSEGIFKLKNKITWDCNIVDVIEGTGRNKGRMGALIVSNNNINFKVGTGFTDNERIEFYNKKYINKIIEVEGMEVLQSGKLRHPRFVRLREDLK